MQGVTCVHWCTECALFLQCRVETVLQGSAKSETPHVAFVCPKWLILVHGCTHPGISFRILRMLTAEVTVEFLSCLHFLCRRQQQVIVRDLQGPSVRILDVIVIATLDKYWDLLIWQCAPLPDAARRNLQIVLGHVGTGDERALHVDLFGEQQGDEFGTCWEVCLLENLHSARGQVSL